MTAMVENLETVNSIAEGEIVLSRTATWRCVEHNTTMNAGKDCAWCIHENLGEREFEKWLDSH